MCRSARWWCGGARAEETAGERKRTEGELVEVGKGGKVHGGDEKSGRSDVSPSAHIYSVSEEHRTRAHGEPCAMLPSARKLDHQGRCEDLQRQQSQAEKLQLVYMYLSPSQAGLPDWKNSFSYTNTV